VDYADRAELRRLLSAAVQERSDFRTTLTLVPRKAAAIPVQMVVAVNVDPVSGRTEVTWLALAADAADRPPRRTTASVRALVDLTTLPLHSVDDRETLRDVAVICAEAVGAPAEVTVTVGEPAAPTMLASTGELAQRLDGAQVVAGEGPCQEAWRTGTMVVCPDLKADPRWPMLAGHVGEGAEGALAVPLQVGDDAMGVLNIYLRLPGEPDPGALDDAELLGTAVGAVLHEIEAKNALETQARQLTEALASRAPIEQAKGLIMATRGCTADEAFAILTKMSNHAHVKLRDLAVRMVSQAGRRRT
jgi:GAF domain-containing protein